MEREQEFLRVAGYQMTNRVGDLERNRDEILEAMEWAEGREADVLVLPELALTGYPLEDLATRRDFVAANGEALADIAAASGRTATVVGCLDVVPPVRSWDTQERDVAIAAAVVCDGELRGAYHKVLLPTYDVFDEARNYAPGRRPDALWRIGDAVLGIAICEDLWSDDGPPEAQAAAGARALLVPNASHFQRGKPVRRHEMVSRVARRNGVPIVYVNCVGGQDDLVYDGGSVVTDAEGEILHVAPQFERGGFCVDLPLPPVRPLASAPRTVHARPFRPRPGSPPPASAAEDPEVGQVWRAICMGTKDFVRAIGVSGVVLGMSGGIDAAVTAAIAAEALGRSKVLGVAMPAPDTRPEELARAQEVSERLGIELRVAEIGPALDGLRASLGGRLEPDLAARERIRAGVLAMLADDLGCLTLATGNKTELSIGAPFGGALGGFAPLRDCPKTLVYELARWRNRDGEIIPETVIQAASTVQRSPGFDLPPYRELDEIVERYVEFSDDAESIAARGYSLPTVRGVLELIDTAELTRRRTPPGVKITARAFGKDRRMPVANAWRPYRYERDEIAPAEAEAAMPPGAT